MLWGEGGSAGAFWELFHLLVALDALFMSDGSARRLEGLGLEILSLCREERNLLGVCLQLEVGVKFSPTWRAGHLWQWVTLVGHICLCLVLFVVSQVLVVHLSCNGVAERFCLL